MDDAKSHSHLGTLKGSCGHVEVAHANAEAPIQCSCTSASFVISPNDVTESKLLVDNTQEVSASSIRFSVMCKCRL
jgi:hypothetical protein